MSMFEAKGIEKRFGAVTALDGVDLAFEDGQILAVLGQNGAGKSTLLRVLAGLARPTAGTIEWGNSGSHRPGVGYLGHQTMLYPELTARENLIFARRLNGLQNPAEKADALLKAEGLQSVGDRRAGAFSRGMAQRLALARAQVHDPKLLLLDEPYTGLDQAAARRLTQRLSKLNADGQSLILITHDIGQIADLAHQAIILRRGRVAARLQGPSLERRELEDRYAEIQETDSWA
ncbi:ABC transporter ATP-binding protein [Myxococcota bacterium]|nr:ABC transporter ATP-binding protein [Myxococcota bacterium]